MSFSENTRAMLWLSETKGVGRGLIKRLAELFSIVELYRDFEQYRKKLLPIVGEEVCGNLAFTRDENRLKELENEIISKDVDIITIADEDFPESLKEISDSPVILYLKGDRSLLNESCIAVVGSRDLTRYGKEVTAKFTAGLAEVGFVIVSGLARGADTEAHRAALDEGGKTIAVLGSGIDVVYPSENRQLYTQIAKEGLIISEYPLGTKANAYQFPERNRLIAGLSKGVLVTEAGLKSGSLITADLALEYGRNLYVVPGNIYSRYSEGCNMLLKRVQGAMVTDVNDILVDMNISKFEARPTPAMQLDFTEELILERLGKGEAHMDELIELSQLTLTSLMALLSKMELFGLIKKIGNNMYGV